MDLMSMSFKGFVFEHNPTALNVTEERTVKETVLPYAGSVVADLGAKKRRVTGEGYFTGADCWRRWTALRDLYRRGGPGSLRLPGQEPFLAMLDSLKLIGVSGKDLVKYSFSFTETRSADVTGAPGIYAARAGESLWDYEERFQRPMEELIAANPGIRDIEALAEGEEVRVP